MTPTKNETARFAPSFFPALMLISLFASPGTLRAQNAIPHIAGGGGFVTGFYAVNTKATAGIYSISFRDDDGKPLTLALSGIGSRSAFSDTIPSNGARYFEADSPTGTLLAGSATFTADAGIFVQALFRRRDTGSSYSEAAVASTAGATQFTIPFDDTISTENRAQIYTGMGLVNMDAQQAARMTCAARDEQGAVIANAVSIPSISALGHWAGYQFPALLQRRGTLNCVSNTKIGAVALRFVDNSMSSLPVIENSSATTGGRRILPHIAAGGGFKTVFYIVNTANQIAAYKLNFYAENGDTATLAISGMGSTSQVNDTLPAYGARYLEADSPNGSLIAGWANVARDPSITVQAIFIRRGSAGEYSEAAIPSSPALTQFTVPFDGTVSGAQIYTGLALANTDVRTARVSCTARDAQGAIIPNAVSLPALSPAGHWAGYQFPALVNKRGTLACSSDIEIAPVALRFLENAMSSLPTILAGPTSTTPDPVVSAGLLEFRDKNAKFSFQYPAGLFVQYNDRDPANAGMTLVRLANSDGSQKMEVRYMSHNPDLGGLFSLADRIEQEFTRTQLQAIFFDWHYGNDSTEEGATVTHVYSNNLRNKNIQQIGTGIYSHFDFADIVFGYDSSKASTAARDTVLKTFTFSSAPSLLGRWHSSAIDYEFQSGGVVYVDDNMGKYTATSDQVEMMMNVKGQVLKSSCSYTMTRAHLRLNCGADGSFVLLAQPQLENFGIFN